MASFFDYLLCVIPLLPSIYFVRKIEDQDSFRIVVISSAIGIAGFLLTTQLIPVVAQYTLKKGICGKDLGKKGTAKESTDVPEALGLVCGVVFLMCTILAQLLFVKNNDQMVIYNSTLFSICFMIFLGYTDDTLDLKWRYKLILPTIASLPLLSTYSGNTALFVPVPFREFLMMNGKLTLFGSIVNIFATVDTEASGRIVELGNLFLIFMGLLAVFCTNAINILAGINGLECGQSYVIACSIMCFKIYELSLGWTGENQVFALVLIIPFIGTALGLLRYNWFPASVFVGDTFCYFAGMTFAVIGIHGHFSKILLLILLPQIFNFVYSIPQLLKWVPCPRHRLPRADPKTHLLFVSAFPCDAKDYQWAKVKRNDTECPNFTILCVILRITGPLHEKTLCLIVLTIQILSSVLAFHVRYNLFSDMAY